VSESLSVAVIDDDDLMRSGLSCLISSAGAEAVTFPSAEKFLADPICQTVDCALIDLRMPGLSGLELQEELGRVVPYLSVIFITGHATVPISVEAMKAGAVDFLEKPIRDEALLAAIPRAARRSRSLRKSLEQRNQFQKRYEVLTPRQRQVFTMVTSGMLNKQIAYELGATEKTIKVHRARVMEKMGASSLADLVRMAESLTQSTDLAN